MSKYTMVAPNLPNIPWQDRPEGIINSPLWRYSENPIIKRNPVKNVARVFNSSVQPWNGKFVGVFRCDTTETNMTIHVGFSDDGYNWNIDEEPIHFVDENGKSYDPNYAYDPRLVRIEDTFYIIWCTDLCGAAIGLAETKDFKNFVRHENPFLPFNRNAVMFPRKINDKYVMLSRPSDSGHTPFGDIFVSESPDLTYWGKHRHVMTKGNNGWEALKIGGGANPIETSEGWLLFYHGVIMTCSGYVYSIGGAILDRDNPSKVLYRCKNYLHTPEQWYEERGYVPNVTFPCSTLQDNETGRIAIYYGAADSYTALAFGYLDEIIDFIKEHSMTTPNDVELGKY